MNQFMSAGGGRRPPVLIHAEALTPDQLTQVQNRMSQRFRAAGSGVGSGGQRKQPGNEAARGQHLPPAVLDADYYPGCYLDVTG